MKPLFKIIIILSVVLLAIQFFRPSDIQGTKPKSITTLSGVPKEVTAFLQNSCFDCHSSQTNLRWFDKITPVNFLVASHIREGKKAFDFSKYDSLNSAQQSAMLYYALNKVLSGEMPLYSYTLVHPNTKLSHQDIEILKNYLNSISKRKKIDTTQMAANEEKNNMTHHTETAKYVKKSLNGINYIPDYRTWKAISSSDRFDNGTMRIIYANNVAVKAIQDGQTAIWPDGAVFAKVAWVQQTDISGNIINGSFKQVEFMIKDSKKYPQTKGWGFARWVGNDLKPYGNNVNFAQECISCHSPMKNQDYVFTSPLNLISFLNTKN
ncbi:cytochrome P460 family protein [Weeksellaceae bacterium A-14]